jgi:hypothetical protein
MTNTQNFIIFKQKNDDTKFYLYTCTDDPEDNIFNENTFINNLKAEYNTTEFTFDQIDYLLGYDYFYHVFEYFGCDLTADEDQIYEFYNNFTYQVFENKIDAINFCFDLMKKHDDDVCVTKFDDYDDEYYGNDRNLFLYVEKQ